MTRDVLIDVSRLIWRGWSGRLPTGIDRVCLAYLDHFAPRALAFIQFRHRRFMLDAAGSDRLFALLRQTPPAPRRAYVATALRLLLHVLRTPPRPGMLYLNVGHTGLDQPDLPAWLATHRLRPIHLVHDLIPITHPQYCREGEADRHALRMRHLLQSAAGIVGNSQATLDELAAFAAAEGLEMAPSRAIWIAGAPAPARVAPYRSDRPYFLALGTIEARKNHRLLLDVWDRLAARMGARTPRLLIVGQRGWRAQDTHDRLDRLGPMAAHVTEMGRCGDAELAALMAGARALLMPSFAEGFGLPVVEALDLGTPVIAADLPVYTEFVGDIPDYAGVDDVARWADLVAAYAEDGHPHAAQRARMADFRAPDWPTHFAQLEEWLSAEF